jgi:hypothetical protein
VFSRFCAFYLPQLVNHYLDPPAPSTAEEWNKSVALEDMQIANVYGYMLVHLNGNPYFDKFFRLPQNRGIRKTVIIAMLDRLHERAHRWEERGATLKGNLAGGISISSMIYDYCQLLGSLILFEPEENIRILSADAKVQRVLHFLDWWDKRYYPEKKAETPQVHHSKTSVKQIENGSSNNERSPPRTLYILLRNGTNEAELEQIRQARHLRASIHVCCMLGCNASVAKDGGSLLQCSQCGTVRYVSSRCSASSTIE